MYQPIQLTISIPAERNSLSRAPLRCSLLFIALAVALAWFTLSPTARAVSPPPDGGYPNGNTAEGNSALLNLTSGTDNTATGSRALFSNTTGGLNTATGYVALASNTTGSNNTVTGFQALQNNATFNGVSGSQNTATDAMALQNNKSGNNNTPNGFSALFSNTTATNNTATGASSLESNTTGINNTANGSDALLKNTTGAANTATGFQALFSNTTGFQNSANGVFALVANTAGARNTAHGNSALATNTTGSNNTATGFQALTNATGSFNIALGFKGGAGLTTGSNNIDIGNLGSAGESNTIRIGTGGTQQATFIAGITGATVPGGVGVIVDAHGHLGTVTSSERFKAAIKPMDKASEAILALRPVTFHYKHELDPEGIPQFGLVAEQVEKVNPDLVIRDAEGKINTVRYEAVNAMLLNEFLKDHRKVEQQQNEIDVLKAELKEQRAFIQRVSDKVEMRRPSPQMVADNQ